jgi:starch-binding outer membrane protein, SusD/RagB family
MKKLSNIFARVRVAVVVSAVALGACSDVTDTLLDAVDPDVIPPESTNSSEGAIALYNGALARLKTIASGTGGEGSTWLFGGLLADEWSTSSTFVQNDETDQRRIQTNNSTITGMFRNLARARQSSNEAIRMMKRWREEETTRIAELYFVRAFAEVQMANDFCNGTPLSGQDSTGALIFDTPRTNEYVFEAAVASADSGLALIPTTATAAQDLLVRRALLITKARALIGLNRIADAAAAVPSTGPAANPGAFVPTSYTYDLTYATSSGDITLWAQPRSARRYTVGDSLEGRGRNILVRNAVPFFLARDSRVPATYTVSNGGRDTTISQDGLIPSRTTTLWGRSTTVAAVNGLDARLIEAEARLKANDIAGMITILNALRAAPPRLGDITPTAASLAPRKAPANQAPAPGV